MKTNKLIFGLLFLFVGMATPQAKANLTLPSYMQQILTQGEEITDEIETVIIKLLKKDTRLDNYQKRLIKKNTIYALYDALTFYKKYEEDILEKEISYEEKNKKTRTEFAREIKEWISSYTKRYYYLNNYLENNFPESMMIIPNFLSTLNLIIEGTETCPSEAHPSEKQPRKHRSSSLDSPHLSSGENSPKYKPQAVRAFSSKNSSPCSSPSTSRPPSRGSAFSSPPTSRPPSRGSAFSSPPTSRPPSRGPFSQSPTFGEEIVNGMKVIVEETPKQSVASYQFALGKNEDIIKITYGYNEETICGLFDGCNRKDVAEEASSTLHTLLVQKLSSANDNTKLEPLIKQAFQETENIISQNLIHELTGGFSSACVTIIKDNTLFAANLGNSRAVLGYWNNNNTLEAKQLTTEHTPYNRSEAERIINCNGTIFFNPLINNQYNYKIKNIWDYDICCSKRRVNCTPQTHNAFVTFNNSQLYLPTTRAFGAFSFSNIGVIAKPEVTTHTISPDDKFVIIASKSLWYVISNEEAVKIVEEELNQIKNPNYAVCKLVETAKEKFLKSNYKKDDISAIVISFNHEIA